MDLEQTQELPAFGTWQPIETAPKDTDVLVHVRHPYKRQSRYDIAEHNQHGWFDASASELEIYGWQVRHWMPLPDAPHD